MKTFNRRISIILAILLVMTLIPFTALAAQEQTIYFSNTAGWSKVNIYYWSDSNKEMIAWPGVAMDLVEGDKYSKAIPADATYVIFNDGSQQTGDLAIPSKYDLYVYGTGWVDSATGEAGSRNIFFDNTDNWAAVYVHYWADGNEMTTWPGKAMTKVDGTIYSISVPDNAAYIIFNNGSGIQTENLTLSEKFNLYSYASGWSTYDDCEHVWGDGEITKDATCEQDGVRTYTCSGCGETKTETIPASGHSYENGVCGNCGAKEPCTNHSWDNGTTTDATCTEDGQTVYTCTNCGHTKTETIPATGHSYANGKCSVCGAPEICNEHQWDEGTVTKEPTCWLAGEKTVTCTICGTTDTITIPGGHNLYVSDTLAPTCTKTGKEYIKCTGCLYSADRTLPKIPHEYVAGEKIAATCTEDGYTIMTCSCGAEIKGEIVYHTGHNWNGNTCSTCGATCAHSYVDGICTNCSDGGPAYVEGWYEIANAAQLRWFAAQVNSGNNAIWGKLIADIDLAGSAWTAIGYYSSETLTPDTMPYIGTFDGQGHTVSNFTSAGTDNEGLFGYCSSATIRNLGVINAKVTGWNAGAVAGYAPTSTVENCFAKDCTITGYSNNPVALLSRAVHIGAVIGPNGGTLKNSYAINCTLVDKSSEMTVPAGETYTPYHVCNIAPVGGTVSSNNYYHNVSGTFTTTYGATEVAAAQLASGEVTYLLNKGVVDGTQSWYQTCGTGLPAHQGKTVYQAKDGSYVNELTECDHSYSEKVTTAASCGKEGVKTYTCSKCGDSYTETIPALEHNYVEGICSNCGEIQIVASGSCGDNATFTLDALGNLIISGTGAIWDFGVYSNCPPWSGYLVTKVTVGSGITTIGTCTFYRHIDITEVSLPDTLTEIREQAFYYCEKLTQIDLPDGLDTMGEHVFEYCTALTSIEIPAGITVLPWATFSCCYALADVILPDTMTEIQGWAFSYCRTLTEIQIPATVNVLGEQIFRECWALETVNIPEGVQTVPSNAFNGCTSLTAIEIPSTVTLIDEHAFHNTGLLSVEVPGSVVEIRDDAFSCSIALESVTMSAGLETIGGYVFFECTGLKEVTIPNTVKTIGSYCFYKCHSLTELVIPDSVTSLGFAAFRDCVSLETITLSNSLTTIEANTFYGNDKLNNVVIPEGVTAIYEYAFVGCDVLTDITFPSTLTTLGYNVFDDCDGMTEMTIPDTVTTMGSSLFYNCDALTKVTLSAGLTAIPDYTFCYCPALTEVVIPDSITAIGVHVFDGCTSLTVLTIPAQITSIGDYAFIDSGLTEITFIGDAPTMAENSLYGPAITAKYPGGNTTWTEDVMQQYGGTVTWVAYSTVVNPTFEVTGTSLSFEDEILYNIYFSVTNPENIVEMGLVTFAEKLADGTIDNAIDVIPGYVTDGTEYMVHSGGIAAKNMGDALWFKVYAKLSDGSYAYSNVAGYHAVLYAKNMLGKASTTEKMKALIVAMLNYGTEAQLYFGYKTDELMNSFLTDEQKALVDSYDESMVAAVVSANSAQTAAFPKTSGTFGVSTSVSFDGAFSVNYYFTAKKSVDNGMKLYYWDAATYNSGVALTKENATKVTEMVANGSEYWAQVSGIAAKEIDQTIYVAAVYESEGVEYTSGVTAYSLGHYCKTTAAKETSAMKDFAAATAVYGYYAKQFFAK